MNISTARHLGKMPLGSRLSEREAGKVDALLNLGKSQTFIANKLKRSRKAIQTYIKRGASYFAKHKNGSKPLLTEVDKRQLVRHVSATGDSVNAARASLGIKASKSTVRRALVQADTFKYVKPKRKPKLTDDHKSARLAFAQKHMTWNLEWRSVIFSDEKKFNLDGPDGFHSYWHDLRKEEKLMSRRVHGGASLMVWAAFCFHGKTQIVMRPCKGDSAVYQRLLERHLVPFIRELGGGQWTFQQDGASVHRSASTMDWLKDRNIVVLEWPALSPDLNPIENLWGILVRLVYDQGRRQFNTVKDLEKAVVRSWNLIHRSELEKLAESLSRRMFQVINKNGASTSY